MCLGSAADADDVADCVLVVGQEPERFGRLAGSIKHWVDDDPGPPGRADSGG